MNIIDYLNRSITLTDDSWDHIHENHPEITKDEIVRTLGSPDEVRQSFSRKDAELYYALKVTQPRNRYICIVVKFLASGNFISTAMTTSSLKKGESLYKKGK